MGRDVSRELEHLAHGLRYALEGVMPGDVIDAKALLALRDLSIGLQRCTTAAQPTNSVKSSDAAAQTEVHSEWLTLAKAAQLADVERWTITRKANSGEIKDNGMRGRKRRVEKSSVLLWMGKRQERQRWKGFKEYSQGLDDIPDRH